MLRIFAWIGYILSHVPRQLDPPLTAEQRQFVATLQAQAYYASISSAYMLGKVALSSEFLGTGKVYHQGNRLLVHIEGSYYLSLTVTASVQEHETVSWSPISE